ncbi:MAG: hypothetical protein Q7U57_19905 [Methylovulum sp.]|nr:hypothetical protein [Methylovulum sp.]
MNAPSSPWIFALGIISATASWAGNDQQQDIPPSDFQDVITLDLQTQLSSGIETITLKPANQHAEFNAYGKALSIQPLLALRHRYLLAITDRNQATARFKQAEQANKRQQALYQGGVSAARSLQERQAQWQADKALLEGSELQRQAIIDESLLNWGKALSGWVLSAQPDSLEIFLNGRKTLLQITLPSNRQLPDNKLTIYVDPFGNRSKAQPAELISAAPQADVGNQGNSYFFQTNTNNIQAGMSVSAWLPEQKNGLSGVVIPKSALIWFMGQACVYIKTDHDTFQRRTLDDYSVGADGYFIQRTVKPGEQIVTTGGQMLLSEEMRGQIPDDDS